MLSVDIIGRSSVIQSDLIFGLHPFDVQCLFSCEIVGFLFLVWPFLFRFLIFTSMNTRSMKRKTTAAPNSIGNLLCEQWRCAWQLLHAISSGTRSRAAKYESHLWRSLMVRGANKLPINGAVWCINMQYRLRCNLCSFSWEFESFYNSNSGTMRNHSSGCERKFIFHRQVGVPDNLPVLELANIALIES